MAHSTQIQREDVAHVAGRILFAWRNGESASLRREVERAGWLDAHTAGASTLEMERLEVLSGVVESLRDRRGPHAGAVRLLEHLATSGAPCEVSACQEITVSPLPWRTHSYGQRPHS